MQKQEKKLLFEEGIRNIYIYFYILLNLEEFVCLLFVSCRVTVRGAKVSMLSHIYPHKPLRKIELTICNHQADSPLYVWPNV